MTRETKDEINIMHNPNLDSSCLAFVTRSVEQASAHSK